MSDLFHLRPLTNADRPAVAALSRRFWGDEILVAHGVVYRPAELPAVVAEADGELVGLAAYDIQADACEIVALASLRQGAGIGSALIDAVADLARAAGCRRLWLITTNDNLPALGFYQRRGMVLVAVHRGAVDRARQLKPTIPAIGAGGIPIRDEIELELPL